MSRLTPAQAQEKQARRLKAATQDIAAGVQRVTSAPGQAAAKKVDKMRANLLKSIDSGKWGTRVASVSLEDWKSKMIDKGIARIAQGIDGAAAKTTDFYTQLFAHQDKLVSEIQRMPDLTLEDSINRMIAMARGMAEFKRK